MLINGGFGVNIINDNLGIQLGLPKPNLVSNNLCIVNQTIAKPRDLIKDLKIFVHSISYAITFIVINSNVLNYNYLMLLRCPWLRDVKTSHDWGTNIVII